MKHLAKHRSDLAKRPTAGKKLAEYEALDARRGELDAASRDAGAAARVVAAWTAADASAHDSAARGLRFRHMALRASAGFDVHVVLHEVDAGDLDAVEGAGGGRGRVTFAEATAARACVDIKSSTRLQCERNRTVWTRLFRCASRT